MPRRRAKASICPRCGADAGDPVKTWTLVSPIPDRLGRVTVTIMGSFSCPSCGNTWRTVLKKMKSGGEPREEEPAEKEPGQIIEIDLSELKDMD